ncbi:pyruvate dehydrogenase complex E1 component subunit beta [Acuticoccus sp. I52.16.1]|uniref:pyruvate dehydrogenase complex E1 component subunit beta n=1 Tax=Acuticoccus sp. I52.16.1 TaxID=2928472 RepID=UPI001FD554A9|nr:pyruvate dehydrogenase complex E1 component subunit beta [Acuticoccus sp. I52.16.1]UOM34590.1 pyruvate dehydrogenase complex E1 component subunit beta [Acuticoccus sp. I52.16.1]
MPTEILMPALSPTMEEGKLAKWLKSVGDTVSAGDVIAEIETDKATMEVEAVDEGTLGKILVEEGTENVPVNAPIAVLLAEGESESDIGETSSAGAAASPEPAAAEASAAAAGSGDVAPTALARKGPGPTGSLDADAARPPAAPRSGPGPAEMPDDQPEEPDVPPGTEMRQITVREALRDAMAEEMRNDGDVFLMGEEVAEYQGAYKISQGLLDEFGARRVIDTPITEHGFTGLGVGAAMAGLKPIVEFMTFNFAMQAIDQIINSAAKTHYMSGGFIKSQIVFRGPNGAAARVAAQHSQDYAAWYAHVPGHRVIQPYSAMDAKGLLKAAIRDPNPVIFLENEILYGQTFEVPADMDFVLPIGKAKVEKKGKDVTIVSFGIGMTYAMKAAAELAGMGIDAEVINLRTIRPLDIETVIKSVQKTNRCVTVEEAFPTCSISSEIGYQLMEKAFDFLDAPVLRVTGKDVPMPYAANLEKLALPSVAEVIDAVKAVTYTN